MTSTALDRPRRAGAPGRPAGTRRGKPTPWLLMAPALVVLLIMTVAPAIYLLRASFRDENLLGGSSDWVGLRNYEFVLTDPATLTSLLLTVMFVVVAVAIELVLALVLAMPLATRARGNTVGTVLLLVPFAITPAVSALVFRELLNPNYGWVNHYLGLSTEWLAQPVTAWVALIALDVWSWTPFVALILIAGRQAVPAEPIEAAALDGASPWQTFRYVVLPQLLPFVAIAVVLRTIQAFKTFDSFKILTGGGPGASTEIINLGIQRIALQSFRIGAASAAAVLLLIVLSLLVPAMLRVIGRNAQPEEH
jgi:multiple sugar transport system permease protein